MESNNCSYALASRELDNFSGKTIVESCVAKKHLILNRWYYVHHKYQLVSNSPSWGILGWGQNKQNLTNAQIIWKNLWCFVKFSCKHKRLVNHIPKGLNRIVVLITLLLSSFYINLANHQQILEFKFDFSLSFCPL